MSDKVVIVGIGSTALGRHPDKSVKDLTREAVTLALDDAAPAWQISRRCGFPTPAKA